MAEWFWEGCAFSIQISKHTFFSAKRGFIFSWDPMRLKDAEAMGLEGVYVYALSWGFMKDDCFVQLCPIDRPMSPESFLKLAWKKSSVLCGKPSAMLLHKAMPAAFPFLEAHLDKIGIPSRAASRADTKFNGVYRSLALRGYHEFFWSDVGFRPDLSSFEGANEFLVQVQEIYRANAQIRRMRMPVPFEPLNWRIESKVVPERLRALLEDGQIRIAPIRSLVLALKDSFRMRNEPWHFDTAPRSRRGRHEVYFVAGRGEVERGDFDAFRNEQRASLNGAPRGAGSETAQASPARSGRKKRDDIGKWIASKPDKAQHLVRRHAGRVWNIWPTGVMGLAELAGVSKKEMNWFLDGRFELPWPALEALARALQFDPKHLDEPWKDKPLVIKVRAQNVVQDFLRDMVRHHHLYCEILPHRGQIDPVWRMMLVWRPDTFRSQLFPALPYVLLFEWEWAEGSIVPVNWGHCRMREECRRFAIPGEDYRAILQQCIDFHANPAGRLDALKTFWIGKQDLLHALEDENDAIVERVAMESGVDELQDL